MSISNIGDPPDPGEGAIPVSVDQADPQPDDGSGALAAATAHENMASEGCTDMPDMAP